MPTKTFLVLCLLCAGLLAGCSKSSGTDNSPAANGNTSATPSNSSTEKVGVAECDDFIAKYEACISGHVPDAQKQQYQGNIDALRSSWRQLAANAGAKEPLELMCKRQVVQARESMKEFNCQF
jgi:hypothetical protein